MEGASNLDPADSADSESSPVANSSVLLYTRLGCHLCDDALALLREHGLEPEQVDIDQDPELRERYNECVPVVVIDGRERFRGRIDRRLLERLLRARR